LNSIHTAEGGGKRDHRGKMQKNTEDLEGGIASRQDMFGETLGDISKYILKNTTSTLTNQKLRIRREKGEKFCLST